MLMTWVAPTTGGMVTIVLSMSGMGYMYNRGEADVARDDSGRVGEVRPTKLKPMALTVSILLCAWLWARITSSRMLAVGASLPLGPQASLMPTLYAMALAIPSLFIRVHSIFDL